jgi:hypothetical protein
MPVPHSQAVAGQLTAAGNPRICQHRVYRMSCEDYDALEERSGKRCEMCGTSERRLEVDHDHSLGWSFVRGLLCSRCNTHLRLVESGVRDADERVAGYLAVPFWRKG